jgi:hypothetical protein
MGKSKLMTTFLPNNYPNSVGDNYLKFAAVSNIGAISFSAMSFIGTQSLFVAIGRYVIFILFKYKNQHEDY